MSRPVRALWIEIQEYDKEERKTMSRPVRALWIEMRPSTTAQQKTGVEAREGLVD